ncbi:MAG: hypothetical protein DIU68_019925 [Chloroflexota bacterium]|nr:MAG: hypothetical protein DIU68_18855 [Chloroflexota bacterium]
MSEYAAGDHRLLRAALLLDSMLEGALGLLCIVLADAVARALGLVQANATLWLRLFGFVLIAYGALLLWVAFQQRVSRRVTQLTIVLNLVWALAVIAVLSTGAFGLSPSGRTILIAVTGAVLLLTVLEYAGLRKLE